MMFFFFKFEQELFPLIPSPSNITVVYIVHPIDITSRNIYFLTTMYYTFFFKLYLSNNKQHPQKHYTIKFDNYFSKIPHSKHLFPIYININI